MSALTSRFLFLSLAILCSSQLLAANIEKLSDNDWLLVKSKNFEITTDLDQEKAEHLIEDLEAYRYFSIEFLKLNALTNIKPLKILAINSNSTFEKLGLPENWAGVFNVYKSGYAAIANVHDYNVNLKTDSLGRHVLFHEYNHFLIRFTQDVVNYPLWYDEGRAEYFGTFKFKNDKVYIGDPSAIDFRIYGMFNSVGAMVISSEKLFNTTNLPLTSKEEKDKELVDSFYAQSFFMFHYLNSSPELRESLRNYIAYLSYGYKETPAFQKAFKMSYADLDKNAKKYLKNSLLMRVISLTDGKIVFPKPEVIISKLNKAAFYSEVSEILPRFSIFSVDAIRTLLEKNSSLNPSDAKAKALLLMHGFTDNPQKLDAEIEQLDPQNSNLLTLRGRGLSWYADILRAAGIASWEENMKKARSNYRRAIKSDSTNPLPYFGLGEVYKFLPTTEPLQEGVVGFDTASLYSRESETFADLADLLIRMDKDLVALPAIRNAIAFGGEKEKSRYSLILDNLELLLDAELMKGEKNESGFNFNNGAIYVGAIANGKLDGIGKITRPNGSYYEGNFINGVMQGKGKLVTYGGFIYEGDFQNGIAKGKGKITYPESFTFKSYVGEIYYATPFGKGVQVSQSGTYDGDFWYSWPQGKGIFVTSDGKTTLNGKWVQGRYEWPEENDLRFVGGVSDAGKRNGYGVCLQQKISKIEWCTFKDGVRQEDTKAVSGAK